MASSSMWAAVSQVATLGVQGIAALVVLLLFGKGVETDAVFAAYGVYGVIVLMCQTLRLTVVARLIESDSPWTAFDRFLGAGMALLAIAVVAQLLLGAQIAAILTAHVSQHAEDVARSTLNILCIAVVGQLVAALGAAALAVREEFRYAGLAYVVGGTMSIAVLVALEAPLGIKAAPIGVAAGSIVSAALVVARLWHHGYRPSAVDFVAGSVGLQTAAMLLIGSIGPLLGQLNFVISLSFAAHLGTGMVTLYTGAYFAVAAVVAVTGSAASLVLAAPIAQTWDGDAHALLPHLRGIMRTGLVIIGPAVAIAAILGDNVGGIVLGSSFTDGDVHRMLGAFLALTGFVVAMLALPLPLLAAFARSQYGAVAGLAVIATAVHVAGTAVALSLSSIVWIGAAASLSALTNSALLLWLIHRSHVLAAYRIVVAETLRIGAAVAACFVLPALAAGALGGEWWDVGAAAVGLCGFALLLRSALPEYAAVATRILEPITSGRSRGARRDPA